MKCLKMFEEEKCTYDQIAKKMDLSYDEVKHALKRARIAKGYEVAGRAETVIPLEERIFNCLKKGVTRDQLCDMFEVSESKVDQVLDDLRDSGTCIDEFNDLLKLGTVSVPDNFVHGHSITNWRGNIARFGLVSDTHLSSKYCRLDFLHRFYSILEQEEIDTVYHAGDILDGEGIYPGHAYELKVIGSDSQVEEVCENYPYRSGIKTRFIAGNHDLSYYKQQGRDVGKAISAEREDLEYLGQWGAYVTFSEKEFKTSPDGINGVPSMYLLHPDSGPAYAISYKPQKLAIGFPDHQKPDIMVIGHYHQAEYVFYSGIHIVQASSFQDMTPYIRRKGVHPILGGWIVEVGLEDNVISSFKTEFVTFND